MDDRSLWMTAAALPARLRTLSALLDKGAAFAAAQGRPFEELAQARLAPDMFPLSRQVSIACRLSWEAAALLSGQARPTVEPVGDSLGELKGRIEETIGKLESVAEGDFRGAAERRIVLPLQDELEVEFSGAELLRDWTLPNVYFHLATAYDILRHKGVPLGKSDFMAHIGPKVRQRAG
jgi:hypothetical protein